MARLIVQVEGVTEEEFVDAVLAPHLLACGWERVVAIRMGRARSRDRRHGVKGWDVVRPSILRHMQEDADCCVTTLVDYYGLPASGPAHGLAVRKQTACHWPSGAHGCSKPWATPWRRHGTGSV